MGSGAGERRVPDVFLVATAQLDLVAEAVGDEQPGRRTRHLDHRVVAGGRAVHDRVRLRQQLLRGGHAGRGGELLEAGHHAVGLVGRCGRRLLEDELTVLIERDEVRERPPTSIPMR